MSKQKQQKSQAPKQAKQVQQEQPKAKGALSAAAAVRLWNGETVTRSMLVAEKDGMSILATELELTRKTRSVAVTTKKRAEVQNGRVHPLDKPITVGTGSFGFDEALTTEEAAQRANKWLKRAASLDQLARQGDEEAKAKAESLRNKAKTLCRAYGLKIEKDGTVAVKSEPEPAETTEPAK